MNITVPDIGDFDSVEIIEILVNVGDAIEKESPLVTLESDKATMEIPATEAGKITEILVSVGEKVSQGSPLMKMEASGDSTTEQDTAEQPTPQKTAPETIEQEQTEQEQPKDEQPKDEQPSETPKKPDAETTTTKTATESQSTTAKQTSKKSNESIPHASPSIRRFARELGADLTQITGSGNKNRILKDDVQAWVKQQLSSGEKAGVQNGIPPIPEVDFSEFGETETVKLSRIKKLSGPHLQRAWLNIPHVTHNEEADISELENFRKSLKEEAAKQELRITLLSFVMKALVVSLKKFPNFNASLQSGGEALTVKKYFNIGIAVDTLDGLVVPVIPAVDKKSIFELAQELAEVSHRAREGKLTPSDIKGGCMSISSLGGLGGTSFTPIINAPEVAILGLSRSKMQPVWNGEEFQPRLMLPLSLSYDHRVIDGAEAARFCSHLADTLSDVRRLAL